MNKELISINSFVTTVKEIHDEMRKITSAVRHIANNMPQKAQQTAKEKKSPPLPRACPDCGYRPQLTHFNPLTMECVNDQCENDIQVYSHKEPHAIELWNLAVARAKEAQIEKREKVHHATFEKEKKNVSSSAEANVAEPMPCPFCGKEPDVCHDEPYHYVRCHDDNCPGSPTCDKETKIAAINAWNTRA